MRKFDEQVRHVLSDLERELKEIEEELRDCERKKGDLLQERYEVLGGIKDAHEILERIGADEE